MKTPSTIKIAISPTVLKNGATIIPRASGAHAPIRRWACTVTLDGDKPLSVVESTVPRKSVAHELAHGWGRPHASTACKGGDNGQVGEDWPPDQRGYIQGIGV